MYIWWRDTHIIYDILFHRKLGSKHIVNPELSEKKKGFHIVYINFKSDLYLNWRMIFQTNSSACK